MLADLRPKGVDGSRVERVMELESHAGALTLNAGATLACGR